MRVSRFPFFMLRTQTTSDLGYVVLKRGESASSRKAWGRALTGITLTITVCFHIPWPCFSRPLKRHWPLYLQFKLMKCFVLRDFMALFVILETELNDSVLYTGYKFKGMLKSWRTQVKRHCICLNTHCNSFHSHKGRGPGSYIKKCMFHCLLFLIETWVQINISLLKEKEHYNHNDKWRTSP